LSSYTKPPNGPWDQRLSKVACPELQPVETLHENPWFSVRNRGGYFTVEHHLRNVVVLPVVNDDSIVMVRARRPVIADVTLELPAGAIEENEHPRVGAARELAEETGIEIFELDRFIAMLPIAESPTRMPDLSYSFLVHVSEQEFAHRRKHDREILRIERLPIQNLKNMMMNGEIYVSLALAVLGIFLLSHQPLGLQPGQSR
jgi:ADP-ribose pyrophosphatase